MGLALAASFVALFVHALFYSASSRSDHLAGARGRRGLALVAAGSRSAAEQSHEQAVA